MTDKEVISRVEVLPTGELLLQISGSGKPGYQHVYREAGGVYWDPDLTGFKSTVMTDWSCSRWFSQIVAVCGRAGIALHLREDAEFVNVPSAERVLIVEQHAS